MMCISQTKRSYCKWQFDFVGVVFAIVVAAGTVRLRVNFEGGNRSDSQDLRVETFDGLATNERRKPGGGISVASSANTAAVRGASPSRMATTHRLRKSVSGSASSAEQTGTTSAQKRPRREEAS
jgi:hypothetical protein